MMERKEIAFYLMGKNDFPLTIRLIENQGDMPAFHSHDFVEVVCVFNGSGTHVLSGESFPLHNGSVFIIPPGVAHRFKIDNNEKLSLYNIIFQPEKLPRYQPELRHLPKFKQLFMPLCNAAVPHFDIGEKNMAEIVLLLQQFMQETQSDQPGSRSCQIALMTLLMCKLTRLYPGDMPLEASAESVIREVQEFLNTHPVQECSINRLARIARMSRSNLLKLFKNATGLPPHQYQLQRLLNKACTELKKSSKPIADIAMDLCDCDMLSIEKINTDVFWNMKYVKNNYKL